jgi:hypothetical protein
LRGFNLAPIHKVLRPDLDEAFTELLRIVACEVPRCAQLFGQESLRECHGRLDIGPNGLRTRRGICS